MISVNSLGVEFSARPLFKDVSFVINKTDRMSLVGKNGAGKSTLLKILAGLQEPTTGSISAPSDVVIGYLPQEMKVSDETTLINETRKVFSTALERKAELKRVTRELETREDYESEEYQKLLDSLNFLHERMAMEDSDNMEAETERTLLGLGFRREDFDRPTSEFSGGWRMRIELAKILLKKCDLLLLDEPTNHLDIESIQWLENFLTQKGKAVLLVSHDRAFLDNVTNRTIEINCGKIYDYKVNYSQFVELRKERVEQQMRAYENQQKMIADTKEFIERFRYKPTKAVQVQSRIKQLEKIIPIEVDEVDKAHLSLKFPPAERSGDFPLILTDVGKAYGEHQVFDHAEFMLRRGDKVAFVGRNGEGKSTLVKCIMGEIPHTGELKIGHNVKIGYFAQNQAQLLDPTLTVFETIDRVAVGDIRLKIRDILGAFMFGAEDIDKKVSVLSGGEKSRLAMIKLLLEPVNFLILDEPTNHLDMRTKDVLKSAIKDFTGTVIVVSHDREFLDGLVDKVYEFGGGEVKENLGGIYDFIHRRRLTDLRQIEIKEKKTDKVSHQSEPTGGEKLNSTGTTTVDLSASGSTPGNTTQKKKLSYAEQKERDKLLRRIRNRIKDLETEIESREGGLSELEEKISAGDCSPEVLADYDKAKRELENVMSLWEVAQMELEEFENN
ncbi:MAG: ABC-F family ATP-binding cassette domain-containing protein [Muribaculaceae bacterium]|nr:ABC-F family ATP-binding cassette domain-containing protein [Muribaculaceae bacterium]